jgi:hypothetical protein
MRSVVNPDHFMRVRMITGYTAWLGHDGSTQEYTAFRFSPEQF